MQVFIAFSYEKIDENTYPTIKDAATGIADIFLPPNK